VNPSFDKNISRNLNVPLSPLLLPPFHTSGEKKKLTSTPSPSTVKQIKKKSTCTLSSSPLAQ
jgi:hypothetical protein